MSIHPMITFKAGQCDFDEETGKVTPQPTPGYLYLHNDEDLMHFCWRKRGTGLDDPELDLIMFPSDCTFTPYQKGRVNGRIFVLKFTSSSQRQFFWMQSKTQSPSGNPSYFSPRDLKIGDVVNSLLQGEDVDVEQAVSEMKTGHPPDDDDATMEDVEGHGSTRPGGSARDILDEGEDAREGGADGGRAAGGNNDAQSIIQNFISSLGGSSGQQRGGQGQPKLFTTLQDLLTPSTTIAWLDSAPASTLDTLMQYLPTNLASLAREDDDASTEPLSEAEKRSLLKRVLRSPQFSQSLASLTFALRDGGLPSISEALGVPVQNGGFMRRGGVPLGGGDAVEAFLNGVRDSAQQDKEDGDEDSMDTN